VNTAAGPDKAPPSEQFWLDPHIRPALANRDFQAIYRHLQKHGYPQRRIGALTRQHQSIVSTVIGGHTMTLDDVMRRAAVGLHIPLCMVGYASCGHTCTHCTPNAADSGIGFRRAEPSTIRRLSTARNS
jgi:hypothetical protein